MEKGLTVSFDLDGTLTKHTFVDGVWNEGIPYIVAKKRGISFEDARSLCMEAYKAEGESSIRWYQLGYWMNFFDIQDIDVNKLVLRFTDRICVFDDAIPVLERLKRDNCTLIIFSNATRPFLDKEVSVSKIAPYFDKIISLPDDWGMLKAQTQAFVRLRSIVDGEFIHAGDHIYYDYEVPRSVGIDAFHIWRGSGPKRNDSLTSLEAFTDRVLCG
ncbi:MAG: HAD family hydrolase [Deltaproteobacteria bacterium]|nr:HAD family hydrolase [Deltaproteobacteria bacterium]